MRLETGNLLIFKYFIPFISLRYHEFVLVFQKLLDVFDEPGRFVFYVRKARLKAEVLTHPRSLLAFLRSQAHR